MIRRSHPSISIAPFLSLPFSYFVSPFLNLHAMSQSCTANFPPVISISQPVMKLAHSEERNTRGFARSSGFPKRFSEISFVNFSR